jgi:hypothetical protein
MKKTIAILLILVIGMVGVFATDYVGDNTKITLTTDIAENATLFITEDQYDDYRDFSLAEEDVADIDIVVGASGDIDVGYLSIFSNLHSGYLVSYAAKALTATIGGTARYINFDVQIGSLTATKITTDDDTSVSKTIKSVTSQTEAEVFSELITITISDDYDFALAGVDYEGSITFTFSAN